jgi:hypothetical protein
LRNVLCHLKQLFQTLSQLGSGVGSGVGSW